MGIPENTEPTSYCLGQGEMGTEVIMVRRVRIVISRNIVFINENKRKLVYVR